MAGGLGLDRGLSGAVLGGGCPSGLSPAPLDRGQLAGGQPCLRLKVLARCRPRATGLPSAVPRYHVGSLHPTALRVPVPTFLIAPGAASGACLPTQGSQRTRTP